MLVAVPAMVGWGHSPTTPGPSLSFSGPSYRAVVPRLSRARSCFDLWALPHSRPRSRPLCAESPPPYLGAKSSLPFLGTPPFALSCRTPRPTLGSRRLVQVLFFFVVRASGAYFGVFTPRTASAGPGRSSRSLSPRMRSIKGSSQMLNPKSARAWGCW